MQRSISQDGSSSDSSNDGYQVLQTPSSTGYMSETGSTAGDEEPPKPVGSTPDKEAIAEMPPEGIQHRGEPQISMPTSRRLALDDYEMQLKLLEAQNKRRLEMARQEQDRLGVPSLTTQTPMNGPPPPHSFAVTGTMPGNPTMAISNRMGTTPPSFRPPNQPDPMVHQLSSRIKVLQDENQLLRRQLLDARNARNAAFAIFHCIAGEDGEEVYLDKPRFVKCGEKLVLEAGSRVQYPEAYGLYKSLHFVVYRKYSAHLPAGPRNPLQQDIETEMPDPEPESESIKFVSDEMVIAMEKLAALDEAIPKKLPFISSDKELRAPHLWWYFYRKRPDVLDGLTPSEKAAMQSLMRWLLEAYGRAHDRVDDQLKRGMISASSMSYLVQPEDVLVWKVEDGFEAHMAASWLRVAETSPKTQSPDKESTRIWEVDAWSYGYDGDLYGLMKRLDIQLDADMSHDAEISIAELNVFPLRFASREIRETLEQRGRRFWKCRNGEYVAFGKNPKDKNGVSEQRYIVDCRTYKNTQPTSDSVHTEDVLRKIKVEAASFDQKYAPPKPYVYLLPRAAMGYDIRRKEWEEVNFDFVQDVSWNKTAFEELVAKSDARELLKALIIGYISSPKEAAVTQSQGKGLAMLLRGAPGTGKTFSVESIAEYIETPIYTVRCSDIGTTPEDVEKYLENCFHLAKTWGCILVLTEAEVFLESRTFPHVERNALVLAFLRALEGYDGILVLETNRLRRLDDAFWSRGIITLRFDPLTQAQRAEILRDWLINVDVKDQDETNFDDLWIRVEMLAMREMNGHEIRNILNTTRRLAHFRNRKMIVGDLEVAVKLNQFY